VFANSDVILYFCNLLKIIFYMLIIKIFFSLHFLSNEFAQCSVNTGLASGNQVEGGVWVWVCVNENVDVDRCW
jgi:hypothetical protein